MRTSCSFVGALLRRKEAAMATYREVEEEWDRKQEEIATTKRINAAKREVERQARVRDATAPDGD